MQRTYIHVFGMLTQRKTPICLACWSSHMFGAPTCLACRLTENYLHVLPIDAQRKAYMFGVLMHSEVPTCFTCWRTAKHLHVWACWCTAKSLHVWRVNTANQLHIWRFEAWRNTYMFGVLMHSKTPTCTCVVSSEWVSLQRIKVLPALYIPMKSQVTTMQLLMLNRTQ